VPTGPLKSLTYTTVSSDEGDDVVIGGVTE